MQKGYTKQSSVSIMEKINEKNILVIGAGGGIGSQTAKLLKQSGANVFIAGRNEEKLNVLAKEIGIPATNIFVADISNPEQVKAMAAHYFDTANTIDVLINAAGIGIIKPFEQLSEQDFLRSLNWNLYGPFLLLQAFLPAMKKENKGLIINIPGVLGKTPMAGAAAYTASKYGLNGMLKSIREELKRTEIRITNLFLGGVDTPFWDTIDMRVQREKFIMADEAAKAIWFLCQQPSSGVVSEMVIQPFNHQVI